MSSYTFCPICPAIPQLEIEFNDIIIRCQCGYENIMPIKDYLSIIRKIPSNNNILWNNESIDYCKLSVNKAKTYLDTYFTLKKNNIINDLLLLISKIESAYENSYNRNNNVLSVLTILIDNYNNDDVMYSNIINNSNIDI